MSEDIKPQWQHDCTNCRLIYQYGDKDVWLCQSPKDAEWFSIVVRESDEPSNYWSMPLHLLDHVLDSPGLKGLMDDPCLMVAVQCMARTGIMLLKPAVRTASDNP